MASRVLVLLAVGAALASGGCSDDGDERESGDSQGNLDVVPSCTLPAACGGDPTGNWTLVEACVDASSDCPNPGNVRGTASGSYSFDGTSASISLEIDVTACGGNASSSQGAFDNYSVTGSTIELAGGRRFEFCVNGDTLWLNEAADDYPTPTVTHLRRTP